MCAFIRWSMGAIIMYDSRTPCMPWGDRGTFLEENKEGEEEEVGEDREVKMKYVRGHKQHSRATSVERGEGGSRRFPGRGCAVAHVSIKSDRHPPARTNRPTKTNRPPLKSQARLSTRRPDVGNTITLCTPRLYMCCTITPVSSLH